MAESTASTPRHLAPSTRAWFREVTDQYALESQHVRLLTLCCEAWDRGQAARKLIEAEGMTFSDRFGQPHAHPAVAIERDARTAYARLLRELDLEGEAPPDIRVPRRRGGGHGSGHSSNGAN